MSYDLNIVVVGQENPASISFETGIELLDETKEALRYHDIWGFMTATHGMWYALGTFNDGDFSALYILDPDFDTPSDVSPYWVSDNLKSNLVPLRVRSEYRQDLEKILQILMARSPLKTLYFTARVQPGDDEIVSGTLSLEQFWELHDKKQILFNVCYILRD